MSWPSRSRMIRIGCGLGSPPGSARIPTPPVTTPPVDRGRAGVGWEVGEPTAPPGQGLSGELVFLPASRTGAGGRRVECPLVVRLAPRRFQLYPWDRFAEQCRVAEILARDTDVPVPPVYGHELDPAVLGAPFVVLGRVDGDVPGDIPPYHMQGFMLEMAPAARARVWDAALVAMAGIHRLDPRRLGLGFAGQPKYGPVGAAQQLAVYERHLGFFAVDDGARDVVGDALAWLHDHPPAERHPVRLVWGDARLGNMIFRGERVAAVLDWEMVSLGQPETDLGWFLHLDRHLSEGVGLARLPGLPGPRGDGGPLRRAPRPADGRPGPLPPARLAAAHPACRPGHPVDPRAWPAATRPGAAD